MKRFTSVLLAFALLALVFVAQAAGAEPAPEEPAMAYCTIEDVSTTKSAEQLARLTGDPRGTNVDEDRVQKAIDKYAGHMEPFVRGQHPDNPFGTTHPLLNGLNVEGALIELAKARPGGLSDAERQEQARLDKLLQSIAHGTPRLMDADEAADPATAGITTSEAFRGKERLFAGHRRDLDLST